jgi:hypothetical protein
MNTIFWSENPKEREFADTGEDGMILKCNKDSGRM